MQVHSAPVDLIRNDEVASVLQELQKAGHIRFLGVTVYGEEAAMETIHTGVFDCIQPAYNLLDRASEARVLPAAQARNLGIIARSVLLKGALTYRYRYLPERLSELKSIVERTAAVAEKRSLSLPELAFKFVLRHPAVSTALVGASSVEELETAVRCSGHSPLSEDVLAELESIQTERPEQLNPAHWDIP